MKVTICLDRLSALLLCVLVATISPCATAEDPPQQQFLFTNVMVFDGSSEQLYNADVLVTGNKIDQVSNEPLDVIASTTMTVIDGGGRTLMPGLIDAHVHLNLMLLDNPQGIVGANLMTWEEIGALAVQAAQEYVYSGFTTVRDLCGASTGLRKHVDAGTIDGPRIYLSGACISQGSGHGDWRLESAVVRQSSGELSHVERLGLTVIADGPDEVLKAARNNLASGADFTKMMAGGGVSSDRDPLTSIQGTMEELEAMSTANRHFGTIGAVHAYMDVSVERALTAGILSIEHGNLMSNPSTFKLMKEKDGWVVPAMAGFSAQLLEHPYYGNPENPAYAKAKTLIDNRDTWIELAKKFEVNVGYGTDVVVSTITASRGARDFQMSQFAEAFGNFRTLKMMTSDNGRLMALTGDMNPYPGKLGVIEPGAYADIILVDGNPIQDITVLGAAAEMFGTPRKTIGIPTVPFVMKDGKIYRNEL
ncbi:MAG: amidohydrolase family protein [Gammaproteobacteria bacterium]